MPSLLEEFKNGAKCPHCNHSDWCYSIGDLTVCNRGAIPADGWIKTSKCDKAGVPYYALESKKVPRVTGREEFIYTDRDNNPLIKVVVVRPGKTRDKDVFQEYWNGRRWVKATSIDSSTKHQYQKQITWYRYADVLEAVIENKQIFIVEGEGVADALWSLGLPATTTIGGAGKYHAYGIAYQKDLSGAKLVLCPDRDEPGVCHMEDIYKDFPDAQWLYAPPSEFYWSKLPKSNGLDVKDWINDGACASEITKAIGEKLEPVETFKPSSKTVTEENIMSNTERLRLDLLDLVQETDSVARTIKRSNICKHYKITKKELESLLKETEQKTQPRRLKVYSFDELLELESESLSWLIPELLPRGELIVLGGAPKSGKTLMAVDAAFAIATGEDDFLGFKCERGKVLVISNDETVRSTKEKLLRRGFRNGDGKNLFLVSDWKVDQLYELEMAMEDFQPDLVIIDSLKSISTNSRISENSAEFANIIYNLKTVLNRFNCAGILIHHTNKNKDAMGVAKLRGSSSIVAATWGTWIIDHMPKPSPNGGKGFVIDPADPGRLLTVFPRDIEGQLLKLEFNPENNSYARTDQEIINEQDKLRDQILAVLRLHKNGLSGQEIIELMEMTKEEGRQVYNELNRMESRRLISTITSNRDNRVTLYTITSQEELVTECQEDTHQKRDNQQSNEEPVKQEFQDTHQNAEQDLEDNQSGNDISLLQVEMDGNVSDLIGCNVVIRKLSGAVKAQGQLTKYDQLNGSVTVKTAEGANYTAHVRETFITR